MGRDIDEVLLSRSRHEIARVSERIAVELRAPAKLAVTLRDGAAIIPCDYEWSSCLYALDTRGQPLPIVCWESSNVSPSITISFDGEGPARLHLVPVDGYSMVAPAAFELKRGETVAVDLPIRRTQ
jgi:hypothetical protein